MAKYVQYHWKGSDIFSKISSQYNFDTNFTYDTYTYNNKELNAIIIKSIDKCLPTWDTRPTLESLDKRFAAGSFVIYQFYQDSLCGWCWMNEKFTLDWINTQTIDNYEIHVGGLYKLMDKELPKNSAQDFGHYVMKYAADNYKCGGAIIEDWNKASLKLFKDYKPLMVEKSFI